MSGYHPSSPLNRAYSASSPQVSPSNKTSALPAHSTNSDFSYFSPHPTATTASSPRYTPTDPSISIPLSPGYPVITATVTSRGVGGSSNTPTTFNQSQNEFALHIPGPPTLTLSSLRHSGPEVRLPSYDVNSRTPLGYENLPSPMDRSRRMPPSSQSPLMNINSTLYSYTLSVRLPASIQPEMVTISANKGDKIKVVADAWHMETESHYEWLISFPPHDIDMSAVHAKFDPDKMLTIDVRRTPRLHRP